MFDADAGSTKNGVADALAKAGVRQGNFGDSNSLKDPPMCARLYLQADIVGNTFVRKVNLKTMLSWGQNVPQTNPNLQTQGLDERAVTS